MVTDQATTARPVSALLAAIPAAVGVLVSMITAIVLWAEVLDHQITSLSGLDGWLGMPSVAVSMIFFSLYLTWFIGVAAGGRYPRALWLVAAVVALLGTAFEVVALVLNFSIPVLVLLVAALATLIFVFLGFRSTAADAEPQVARSARPWAFGTVLTLAGIGGLIAAYNLTLDKITVILDPNAGLNCNVSIVVQCGKNLGSWQGSLFGFPNPLIGLGGYAAVLVIGILTLAGVRFPRWWNIAFNIGVMMAMTFILFLITSSIFFIGTLCLWCALVWTVTIPTFWLTTIRNLKSGDLKVGPRATKFWTGAYTWIPILTLICYGIVFLLYEIVLNLLARL